MKSITRLAPTLVALAVFTLPSLALAYAGFSVDSNGNFMLALGTGNMCGMSPICQVATTVIYLINGVLVPVLFALAFIVFLYGVAKSYIFSTGDEEAVKSGHKIILWGIIGFAVMVSLWGLVNVVANTFGLAGSIAPPTPTSTGFPAMPPL